MRARPPALFAVGRGEWLAFEGAAETLVARSLGEVEAVVAEVERGLARGLWAAGLLAYEAAPAFDGALAAHAPGALPLAWFGLFPEPRRLAETELPGGEEVALLPWSAMIDEYEHRAAIAAIREWIARGDTYQVNFTVRLATPFAGDPWDLFGALRRAQPTPYAAWLDLSGEQAICSASPELFFGLQGERLVTRPMKGTAARGRTTAEDARQAAALAASSKDRAENLMIVDMARNDLGRVARAGTVRVEELFTVERYPSLFQMTSTVAAATDAPLSDILRALFPAASITGAPKAAAMGIVRELEDSPRGAYTGALGWAAPGRRARFSVAIRTVTVDRAAGRAEYGTGGGIVWDSTPEREAEECRTKALLLTRPRPHFELLETLLWEPGRGYFLLDRHLARLADSAAYFDFTYDEAAVRTALAALAEGFPPAAMRVGLRLGIDGVPRPQATPLPAAPARWRLALAREPVDAGDPFLFHKTTHRRPYERARGGRPGVDEVLLWNERGEVTEGTRTNLVARLAGRLVTPSAGCGLLPGTFRAELLARRRIVEGLLQPADLERATALYLINSLRRWVPADLE
jgi:para-aminobenzoate synthetase/4-amino-4-deoxychorismate lyase